MALNLAHLAIVHAGVTFALTGVIWVVQLAVYPLFDRVGRDGFAAYHRAYVRGISGVVVPLIAAEALSAVGLLWLGVRGPLFLGSLVLIATIWAITFAVEMPLHRQLAGGYDPVAHRQLVLTNWARTLAWTARAAMIGVWLFTLSGG